MQPFSSCRQEAAFRRIILDANRTNASVQPNNPLKFFGKYTFSIPALVTFEQ
jgi:hypothetical protein